MKVDDPDVTYRNLLNECETQAASDFDKTTVSLAGGALGVSFAFLKDIAPNPPQWALNFILAPAWFALTVSLLAVLLSLIFSMKSMRYQIECLDGRRTPKLEEQAGGWWREWTDELNWAALIGCIAGIVLLLLFVLISKWS
jgi:hypothetical protein